MAWPAGLATKGVSLGDAVILEAGLPLTMRVTVRASRSLVHLPSGDPLLAVPTIFTQDAVAHDHVITLPVCDSPDMATLEGAPIILGVDEVTHTYRLTVEYLDASGERASGSPLREIGPFRLLSSDASPVDLDGLFIGHTAEGVPYLPGEVGPPNSLTIGTVTTGAPGSAAEADIWGDPPAQTLDLTIPEGAPSVVPGPPNSLTIGTVTTGAPGSAADADITGDSPNQTLDLTIPRGAVGAASTVPGPPNVLTIGTVTTSAPGSAADADITGVAPNQTLDLTLPQGLQGPQGYSRYLVQDGAAYPARPLPAEVPVTFVGSASPETLGVMVVGDSWINTAADAVTPYVKHYDGAGSPEGVVAAQIGSRYIDVNATAGAVEWTKMSGSGNTGWKVTVGDTGWRNISSLLANGWTGSAYVKRTAEVLTLELSALVGNAATGTVVLTLPVGFRVVTRDSRLLYHTTAPALKRFILDSAGALTFLGGVPEVSTVYGQELAPPSPTWPTTLPGTAA